jgi:hypothetical protein
MSLKTSTRAKLSQGLRQRGTERRLESNDRRAVVQSK